jgi:uncharacterized membrane protein YdjX (TVP38/TMEM64 family)
MPSSVALRRCTPRVRRERIIPYKHALVEMDKQLRSSLKTSHEIFTPRRVLLLAALFGVGTLVFWLARSYGTDLTPEALRAEFARLGPWGPIALVSALALVLVVPLIPATLFHLAAGLTFGPLWGFVLVLLADFLGASAGFWLARRWGRALVDPRLSAETRTRLAQLAKRMSWRAVMLLRLLPGPAYPLVSFAAGYSRLSFRTYTLASLAGVLPSLALLAVAGDLVASSPLLAFALVAALVGGLAFAGRLLRSRVAPNSEHDV